MKKTFEPDAAYQPKSFAFRDTGKVAEIIGRYPAGRQQSAIMPLLDLVQRQVAEDGAKANPPYGGWAPRVAMDEVARLLDVPPIKVYEVATFYTMFNLAPVGQHLIQVCTTTPCWLCGSDAVVKTCKEKLGIGIGETTEDGKFSLVEVECLGACVNAPMVQVNDTYYEDLNGESVAGLIDTLARGETPKAGSQTGRRCAMGCGGATSLEDKAKEHGITIAK